MLPRPLGSAFGGSEAETLWSGVRGLAFYHVAHLAVFARPNGAQAYNELQLRQRARRAAQPGGLQALWHELVEVAAFNESVTSTPDDASDPSPILSATCMLLTKGRLTQPTLMLTARHSHRLLRRRVRVQSPSSTADMDPLLMVWRGRPR